MDNKYLLPRVDFGSDLVATLFEIERLRSAIGGGTTPRATYVELHRLFDTVMSVVSARIEGNHTTVYEALDGVDKTRSGSSEEGIREITNIVEAMRFIDDLDAAQPLTHSLIRELHRLTVTDLRREGDANPGSYREVEVAIADSEHVPPSWVTIHSEMGALLDFANAERPPHEHMLQTAIAHHRFVWIHPFRNGNGRVSRLFTYAMLRRTVFATRGYSALNPTAVFGNDRTAYINALEAADDLGEDGTTTWITFFANGIRDDLDRLIRLQDQTYVIDELVGPAITSLARDGLATTNETAVLETVLRLGTVKAGDLEPMLPGDPSRRSRAIKSLLDRGFLVHAEEGPRFYRLALAGGPLAPRLIRRLDALGYLPKMLSADRP